jgi:hypothetical protein
VPSSWSAQRIAICVLDAHATAMRPEDVLAVARLRGRPSLLTADSARSWRRGAAVRIGERGLWELDREHPAVRSARLAVRERIATQRRWAEMRPDPALIEARRKHFERKRREHGERLARMRRVVIHAFPAKRPEAVVLVDAGRRQVSTFVGDEIAAAKERLADYDIIAAVGVRALLRALGFEPGARRLGELGPPQKTMRLNRFGRTLRITTSLLVRGSCGIARPFGDEALLRRYLREGGYTRLRRRLEADAKSLFALYQYGRLHGAVRVRWGFLDEAIPAPWVHADEARLYDLKARALELGAPLEVVAGSAPGLGAPVVSRPARSRPERSIPVAILARRRGWLPDPGRRHPARAACGRMIEGGVSTRPRLATPPIAEPTARGLRTSAPREGPSRPRSACGRA